MVEYRTFDLLIQELEPRQISAEPSVEPSSTTITRAGAEVCAAIESRQRPIVATALYIGTTIVTSTGRGGV